MTNELNLNEQSRPEVPRELDIAAEWWASRLNENIGKFESEKARLFKANLIELLMRKYSGHWHIHHPLLGSGFRSILFDETCCDSVLKEAALKSGITQYEKLFPAESVVMWVDPGSVVLKFLSSNKMKTLYNAEDMNTNENHKREQFQNQLGQYEVSAISTI